MSNNISFLVGNGGMVKFWKDKWCGDNSLSVSFPSLFALADSKEGWVEDVWNPSIEKVGWGWNPYFSKPFYNWEVDCVVRFWCVCMRRKCIGIRKIECFGQRQRVASL